MKTAMEFPVAKLSQLPISLPAEGAITLELQEGIPILRTSSTVQRGIERLLQIQQERTLSAAEEKELDSYEEIDDYISLLNRITRNLYIEAGNN
jgi:hypothetical protein